MGIGLLVIVSPASGFHFPWDSYHDPLPRTDPPNPSDGCRGSACSSCTPGAKSSPCFAATGFAVWSTTDIALRGRPAMMLTRTYNSSDPVISSHTFTGTMGVTISWLCECSSDAPAAAPTFLNTMP